MIYGLLRLSRFVLVQRVPATRVPPATGGNTQVIHYSKFLQAPAAASSLHKSVDKEN